MRKLATIQKITNIELIQDADRIEVASVLGWKCVVLKGQFSIGDLCVFCEVDSWLPLKPEFEFLRKSCYKKNDNGEGHRIKTIRLRRQISQGLCLPLNILDNTKNNKNIVWQRIGSPRHKITIAKKEIRVKIGKDLEHELDLLKINVSKIINDIQYEKLTLRGIINLSYPGISFYSGSHKHLGSDGLWIEGSDVTDVLEIKKYEPVIPACIAGMVKGMFPSFISKTDEDRVQILQDVLTKYKGTKCFRTEKVDGSSITFFTNNNQFGVCTRNLELKESADNTPWKLAREYDLENKLKGMGNIALQGELVGVGIQKNYLKISGNKVLFFNAFDIDKHKYLDFEDFKKTIEDLGLETVPILDTDYILNDDIDELIEQSKGVSKLNSKVFREGIVIRPLQEQIIEIGRFSLKAINPEYLIKFEE